MPVFFAFVMLCLSSVAWADDQPQIFRDCADCPELVVINPGEFVMGDDDGYKYERPAHPVKIEYGFALGRFEVTFEEWEACVKDGGCEANPGDHEWGRGRRPVINVSYADIAQYLAWLSAKTKKTYRLPSEAEWEYAARAGTQTEYWWGDTAGTGNANCRKCGSEWSGRQSAPVGSFLPNPFGLHDMNGNVWEWVQDCWSPHYAGAPTNGAARMNGNCQERVMRGGSWYYFPKLSRSAYRYKNRIDVNSYNISFRVLRVME